jgi:hypothetical protein
MGMTRTRRSVLASLALLAVVSLGACSTGDDDSAAARSSDEAAGAETAGGEAAEGDAEGAGGDGAPAADVDGVVGTATATAAQLGRDVVRTAEVSVTVDDVAAAAGAAIRIAEQAGGFQASSSLDLGSDLPSGSVVLRVPTAGFGQVVAAIGELGDVVDQRTGSDDVTGTVVDLEARVLAARASVERVRGFLDRTGNVGELAAVERELLTRESELESLLGQLAAIRDQVELATVTAHFGVDETAVAAAVAATEEGGDDIPAPSRALRNGWEVLVDAAKVLAAGVAFAAPFALVVVPGAVAWRFVQRRGRRLAS